MKRAALATGALLAALLATAPGVAALRVLDEGAPREAAAAPGERATWLITVRLPEGARAVEVALTPPLPAEAVLTPRDAPPAAGQAGTPIPPEGARVPVPDGEACWRGWCSVYALHLTVEAPPEPGRHETSVSLVEEGPAAAGVLLPLALEVAPAPRAPAPEPLTPPEASTPPDRVLVEIPGGGGAEIIAACLMAAIGTRAARRVLTSGAIIKHP